MSDLAHPCRLFISLATLLLCSLSVGASPLIVVRNNHEMPYNGPVMFNTGLPDGFYKCNGGRATVFDGIAQVVANLPAQSELRLKLVGAKQDAVLSEGAFSLAPDTGGLKLLWQKQEIGRLELGLVVIPGKESTLDNAVSSFQPLDLSNAKITNGVFSGNWRSGDYDVEIQIRHYAGGWADVSANLTRVGGNDDAAYVALVRKVTTKEIDGSRMRWHGRVMDGASEPAVIHKDFRYTHGTDWCSWKTDKYAIVVANRFTPGLTTETTPGRWVPANNFFVLERLRSQDNSVYFISEVAGPDPLGKNVSRAASKTYIQPLKGEPVKMGWRIAVSKTPKADWEESQFFVSAGYRMVTETTDKAVVDLGVPYVQFGTSYFPYSTMTENHDFYRTAGLNQEGWWPFSAKMWENWRAYTPQMQTDFRIIKAMGFDWVRMHHLEMLAAMDRKNAMEFIDWYMQQARQLGLKVIVDTSGSTNWFTTLAGRYKDVAKSFEIENEILIPGIKPGDTERWIASYKAVKAAAPNTDAFLTGNCDEGMFERLVRLGVPFDRTGFHFYLHGPGWEETLCSTATAMGGHGTDLGKPTILGEFNWKEITRYSPEARAAKYALGFGKMLEPRAIPELFQFHFQETMSVNPEICRIGIRHYETMNLDRRPKLEGVEFMKLIKRYSRPNSPVCELPIKIDEITLKNGKAKAVFTLKNETKKQVLVKLSSESFGESSCRITSKNTLTLKPGESAKGQMEVSLKPGAKPGTYHYFLKANYSNKTAYGWGIASNPGAPEFDAKPVLPELVEYPQGLDIVKSFDWNKPICVAFGKDSAILELEMAYVAFSTLQSATGRAIRLCSTEDIPASMLKSANLILVGSPTGNPLVAQAAPMLTDGKGTIILQDKGNGRQWLLLAGKTPKDVKAATTDFVLRYWENAKDSTTRISGMEKGAALGNRAVSGDLNPP